MVTVIDTSTEHEGTMMTSFPFTSASNTSDPPPVKISPGDIAFRIVWQYIAPVIFVTGMVGNILIVLVMRRNAMKGNTAAVYLPIIAIADALTLFSGIIPEWLEACNKKLKFKEISEVTCRLEKIVFYTSADTAIWLLVAFTFDRFIAVCFPFRKTRWCTVQRALVASAAMFVLAFIKNMHVFWTRGVEYNKNGKFVKNCGFPTNEYKYFEKTVRPWLVFILVTLLPFILILSCNMAIVYRLYASKRVKNIKSRQKSNRYSQTTIMCIGVSILFLVTVTPSVVMYIGRLYWEKSHTDAYAVAKAVTNVIMFLNHSLNFFVYCLSGKRFRRELARLFNIETLGISTGLSTVYTIRGRPSTWRRQPSSQSASESSSHPVVPNSPTEKACSQTPSFDINNSHIHI